MNASQLAVTLAVGGTGFLVGRFVLATVGRAGDGMATLFVPPDRDLGWPRGVQEGDDPWGWRSGRPVVLAPPIDSGDDGRGAGTPSIGALSDAPPRAGSFTVAVAPVRPIRIELRPDRLD